MVDQAIEAVSAEGDEEPISVPAVLTGEQVDRVRAALKTLRSGKTAAEVATQLGYPWVYVQAVVDGVIPCTGHFAVRVAAAGGGEVEDFLRVPPGSSTTISK